MGAFNNKYCCIFAYKENTARKFNTLVHPINFYTCTIIVETVCRVKQSLQSAKTPTGIHEIVFLNPLHWNQFSRCFPTYPIFLWVTREKLFNIIFIYIYIYVGNSRQIPKTLYIYGNYAALGGRYRGRLWDCSFLYNKWTWYIIILYIHYGFRSEKTNRFLWVRAGDKII